MPIGTPMELEQVKLGVTHKDWMTGLTGTATGKAECMHGGSMVRIETLDSTGRPIEQWVPLERITDDF